MESFNIPESPIALTGKVVLWVSFLVAGYAATAGIVGNVQRRRRLTDSSVYALYAFFALMMLASALIIYAFVTHDYTIKYVARYSDVSMPLYYKITAYWGGLDGSMLFWVAVLSAFAAIAVRANRKRHSDMIGYVVGTIMVAQLFFLAILIYAKNPFNTYLTTPPTDGEGLNPLLQNYWMVIHPPALYIGFVSATIPFAFCIGALASGRLDDRWLSSIRSWMLICFFFLSFGLILGGRWAYEELGWGGYWAWDPVENAGLLPWFTATAFLHSVIIQEQRGMMKVWNIVLVVMTFFLTIFGTFMTRSGVVQSVHAFGEDNELALLFILFMAFVLIVSFGLLLWRLPKLRAMTTFESFISREFAFLLNNWILLGCAVFVLFATMFPTISESINGERITVGPEFFNRWMTPLGMILLFLAGAAPLLAYRRTTRERLFGQFVIPLNAAIWTVAILAVAVPASRAATPIFSTGLELPIALVNFGIVAFVVAAIVQEYIKGVRVRMKQTGSDPVSATAGLMLSKRRKYGGYLVHLGVALMFFGFAGNTWETMEDKTVAPGESFEVGDYTFRYKQIDKISDDHMAAVIAKVELYEGTELLTTLVPERRKYRKGDGQPTTEVDLYNRVSEDVYIVLTGFEEATRSVNGKVREVTIANFRVYINPLINWVWFGFLFFFLGCAICLVPQRWVDGMSPRRRARLGKAGELAVILLTVGVTIAAFADVARAQSQAPAGAQYTDSLSHVEDVGVAHRCRPNSEVATDLMKELVCTCGGCQRESLYECKCGYAMQRRCEVLEMLDGADLESETGKKEAYDKVVAAFVESHGQKVLATPKSKLSWGVPLVAAGGALLLVFGVGRAWVRRGRQHVEVKTQELAKLEEDDEYADILDDELRETD